MYIGSGTTLDAQLSEAIVTGSGIHVNTTSVDTANNISVVNNILITDTLTTIIAADSGFVDEINIRNTDTITHELTLTITAGAARQIITVSLVMGASLIYKPKIGWKLLGSNFSSGWVTSGMIGAVTVSSGNVASGQIGWPHLQSGRIHSGDISDNTVLSGSIGSGQITTNHLASGAKIDQAEFLISDNRLSAETISGGRAVTFNTSGGLVIAMAGQSGRFPALGYTTDNVLSGQIVNRNFAGRLNASASGGTAESPIYLGASGELTELEFPGGSGFSQILAYTVNSGAAIYDPRIMQSGLMSRFNFASGSVLSGHIGSGALDLNLFISGCIRSGSLDVESISNFKFISGTTIERAYDTIIEGIATEELISGTVAVNISPSGRLRIAYAGYGSGTLSGGPRMPAIGIFGGTGASIVSGAVNSVLSGTEIQMLGHFYVSSGLIPTSGFGSRLFVGMSGELVTRDGVVSGMVVQPIGINIESGAMIVRPCLQVTSGLEVGLP